MAAIGVGGRGTGIMKDAAKRDGVKFVAVCDVDSRHAEKAAEDLGGDVKTYKDFRELLANEELDAVTIGTPDHWHTLTALAAVRAGLDVYCEKPLTLWIDEGKALVEAVREHDAIFQVGSQQRSDRPLPAWPASSSATAGSARSRRSRPGSAATRRAARSRSPRCPDELDWDFWLGQTPEVAYIPERCHAEFRWWRAYSGGKMTDWGAHHNDIAQWGLGKDGSGPVKVDADGDAWPVLPNCYDMPERFVCTAPTTTAPS